MVGYTVLQGNSNISHKSRYIVTYRIRTADIHNKVYQNTENSEQHYAFSMTINETKYSFVNVPVGWVLVKLLVDCGANVNVIDQKLWISVEVNRVKYVNEKSFKELFAYGG